MLSMDSCHCHGQEQAEKIHYGTSFPTKCDSEMSAMILEESFLYDLLERSYLIKIYYFISAEAEQVVLSYEMQ